MLLSRITPCVLIGFAGAAASAQTAEWAAPVNGNWSQASNWDPADVPDTAGEDAVLGLSDPYAVSFDLSAAIRDLAVLNPAAVLSVNAARSLTISGADLANAGLVQLNPQNSSSNAILAFSGPTLLSGGGEIQLRTGSDNSQIVGPGVLTQAAGHTIRGVGQVSAPMINEGAIRADVSVALSGDELLLFMSSLDNRAEAVAEANATLRISTTTVVQSGSGAITAADGGIVELDGAATIIGGTLESQGAGFVTTVAGVACDAVTNNAHFFVQRSTTLTIGGSGLTNNGLMELNAENSSSNAILHFSTSGQLDGSGEMQLRTSADNSQITAAPGEIISHGPTHLIRGVGTISAGLVNNGDIRADASVARSGTALDIIGETKVNNALMAAAAGSELDIVGTTIDQSSGGTLRALDGGGAVRLGTGATVLGGLIETEGDGVCTTIGSPTLESVVVDGLLHLNRANTLTVGGTGLINNGIVQLNNQNSSSDAVLHFAVSGDLGGTGEIQMRTSSNNAQITSSPTETIHHRANHLIRGVGELSAELVNDGEVRADISVALSGTELDVFGAPKVNNGLMSAASGSELDVTSTTVDQRSGGTMLARDGGGQVRLGTGAIIVGGSLMSEGDGTVTTIGSPTLEDVTIDATSFLNAAHTLSVAGAGLTNNGIMTLNIQNSSSDASLRFAQPSTLGGSGEVALLRAGNNSNISGDPDVTVTNGPDHTISGLGDVNVDLINAGTLRPGNAGPGALDLNADLSCEPTAVLEVEIVSTATFDSLDVAGAATLAGSLEVIPTDGYTPAFGDAVTIVGAASVAGEFDSIDAPALGDPLIWAVQYRPTEAILRVTCRADTNVDGVVNTQDVLAFLNAWTAGDPEGDFDQNGSINTLDVLAFLNAWTTGC